MIESTDQKPQPRRYFRLVYTSVVNNLPLRGPKAEIVVEAETLEAAIRDISKVNRFEGKMRKGIPATTIYYKVEEVDEAAFQLCLQDEMTVGRKEGDDWLTQPNFNSILEREAALKAQRQARRVSALTPVTKEQG